MCVYIIEFLKLEMENTRTNHFKFYFYIKRNHWKGLYYDPRIPEIEKRKDT